MNVQIPSSQGGFGFSAKVYSAKPNRKSKLGGQMSRRKVPENNFEGVDVKEEPEDDTEEEQKRYPVNIILEKISCPHTRDYRQQKGSTRNFKQLVKVLFGQSSDIRHKHKVLLWFCYNEECKDRITPRIHVCLHCKFSSCHEYHHTLAHYHETNHFLAIDINYGQIYCFGCNKYIFDDEFIQIMKNYNKLSEKTKTTNERCYQFNPTNEEENYFSNFTAGTLLVNDYYCGLRGLVNLGSTCFMNCIIQTLLHTPTLRDHFLQDDSILCNHRCKFIDPAQCLVCEMTKMMQEFYTMEKTPYIPYQLLHLVWTHAKHLAGYEQQDAHEFFISTLDILHRHSGMNDDSTNKNCRCIIDKTFSGYLQSDVVCQACGGVSSVVDPIWDFSLDLVNTHIENGKPAKEQQPSTLVDCLYLFTRTEHLGSSAKIKCSNCQTYQESTKKLSLKRLPLVASFHLKRFEQTNRFNKKISTYISFPLYLDMTPFTTKQIGAKKANAMEIDDDDDDEDEAEASCDFDDEKTYFLFAVVNHSGTLETGHYTAFIRQKSNEWYKCDDHFVMKATEQEVLHSEGYLLFYHRKTIQYK